MQTDQMIHSAADSAAVQFDWEAAVWEWKKWAEIVNNFICEFKNKKKIWKSFSQIVSCCFLLYNETSMSSESSNQEK